MVLTLMVGPGGATFKMVLHLHIVPQCSTRKVLPFELFHLTWVSHITVVSGSLVMLLTSGRSKAQVSQGPCPRLAVSLLLNSAGPNHIQEAEKESTS